MFFPPMKARSNSVPANDFNGRYPSIVKALALMPGADPAP
jgi:hypothetical protein